MALDYDDAENISRCSSSSRGVKRTSRSRTNSSSSPRGSLYREREVMHIDHTARLRLHLNQKEKEKELKGGSRGISQAEYAVQWAHGSCSKLGPRDSNEDRMVAVADLVQALSLSSTAIASETAGTATATRTGTGAGTGTGTGNRIGTPTLPIYHTRSVSDAYNSAPNTSRGMGTGTGTGVRTPTPSSYRTRSASDAHGSAINSSRAIGIEIKSRKSKKTKDVSRHQVKQGYFAVYDGHCGAQAASHLQQTLHASIYNHPLYHTDINAAVTDVCVSTDRHFLAHSREKMQYSGSTALGALIRGNELVVFNIGDCHAVVCCDGNALNMSIPHKPDRCVIKGQEVLLILLYHSLPYLILLHPLSANYLPVCCLFAAYLPSYHSAIPVYIGPMRRSA